MQSAVKFRKGVRKFVNVHCMRNYLKRLENVLMTTGVKIASKETKN